MKAMIYSVYDIEFNYKKCLEEFKKAEVGFTLVNKTRKIIEVSGGLAITNSIHEMYIKSILEDYVRVNRKKYGISSYQHKNLVKKYKSPLKLKKIIDDLELDLTEGFNLKKEGLASNFSHLNSYEAILTTIIMQRDDRNHYLHGDFSFNRDIEIDFYKEKIVQFQQLHSFMLGVTYYSFNQNKFNLPNLLLKL